MNTEQTLIKEYRNHRRRASDSTCVTSPVSQMHQQTELCVFSILQSYFTILTEIDCGKVCHNYVCMLLCVCVGGGGGGGERRRRVSN